MKYYTVRDGSETLSAVAQRYLGTGSRSFEIFDLNAGRKQPDGAALTSGSKLKAGWHLVLPWDAVGEGVDYGTLPAGKPPAAASPPPSPRAAKSEPPRGNAGPASNPPPSSAAPPPPSAPVPPEANKCVVATSPLATDWTREKLGHERAWVRSRGANQLVAIIDSGVDGKAAGLQGHVAAGTDLVTGGKGDVDCVGTGTAMAGVIAAQPKDGTPGGLAPASTVLPVRLVAAQSDQAKPADQVKAIEAAVSAGVGIIALGPYVNTADEAVAKAVQAAVDKNVVVVLGAPVGVGSSTAKPGVLRVGGLDKDGRTTADYQPGGVDVVAPGADVSNLGGRSNGPHLAVAFVAGQAALIRAVYPELDAKAVTERIQRTAAKVADRNQPDPAVGWGLIDPVASLTSPFPEENSAAQSAKPENTSSGSGSLAVMIVLFLLGAAFILVGWLIWRFLGSRSAGPDDDDDDDDDEHSPSSFGKLRPALIGSGAFWGDDRRGSDDD
ncbi:S8 family serine peptidase [Virgisporangium aliadipatigenens]|uniref:S8 family serine peptidase n=1 Tax=Virgisporangium aliadipatigenens TaxID=741659 RepID=UPI0019430B99|nr:S8 family serine peptidase [Virgisporangium aliadipatigenens]